MKKILFIAPTMNFGGAERVMSILANHWVEQKCDISFLITQSKESVYELNENIKVKSILESVSNGGNIHLNIVKEIRRYVKENRPDYVICFYNDVCALTLIALLGTKIPVIYSERNDPKRVNQRKVDKVYRRIVEHFSKRVVFQSEGAKQCYKSKVQRKSVVILNPFDAKNLPNHSYDDCNKIIVSVGRLSEQKRQDVLIKAFDKIADNFPEYSLRIYGEGASRTMLQNLINELGRTDRILLMGNEKNVLEKVAESEIFVLTSDYEGIPNVLIEAMALGMPVISTDCSPGGARMLIDDANNGMIVACEDVNAISQKISYFILNKNIEKELGNNAKYITKKVSIEEISKEWMNMLNSID